MLFTPLTQNLLNQKNVCDKLTQARPNIFPRLRYIYKIKKLNNCELEDFAGSYVGKLHDTAVVMLRCLQAAWYYSSDTSIARTTGFICPHARFIYVPCMRRERMKHTAIRHAFLGCFPAEETPSTVFILGKKNATSVSLFFFVHCSSYRGPKRVSRLATWMWLPSMRCLTYSSTAETTPVRFRVYLFTTRGYR